MIDVESFMLRACAAAFPQQRVCTETPAKMETLTNGVIQVLRTAGTNNLTLDRAQIAFSVFHPDRETARTLAELVRDWVVFLLPATPMPLADVAATVAKTSTVQAPVRINYVNDRLRMFVATYYVWIKPA